MLILPQLGQNPDLAEYEIKSSIARDVPPSLAISIVHDVEVKLYTEKLPSTWGQLPAERVATIAATGLSNWFIHLGGTKRLVDLLGGGERPHFFERQPRRLAQAFKDALGEQPVGERVEIGLSSFDPSLPRGFMQRTMMELKRQLKQAGARPRIIIPGEGLTELSAATVRKNQLLTKGYEIILIPSGHKLALGLTLYVHDPDRDALLDRGIPAANARSGMLPPKLARMMVNIALGDIADATVLDPFCGNGRILLEAVLLGHKVVGRDKSSEKVDATKLNLAWLETEFDVKPQVVAETYDAAKPAPPVADPYVIATEPWLGPPLRQFPTKGEADRYSAQVEGVILPSLDQLLAGHPRRVLLVIPAWRLASGPRHSFAQKVLDGFSQNGYDARCIARYARSDSFIEREIILAVPK